MNRLNMNADNLIDEIIKDARNYLIKSRLRVGTATSVGYKDVRTAFYVLDSKSTADIKEQLTILDKELSAAVPTGEDALKKAVDKLIISYNRVIVTAEDYLNGSNPLSAMARKRYETVDRVLCQLNMELSRLKYVSVDEVKATGKKKLTFEGFLTLNATGKTVKGSAQKTAKKLVPGKNAESLSLEEYTDSVLEADRAAVKKNRKNAEALFKEIETALENDERVVLKLKAESGRTPELSRFKVLGLAEKDGVNFVMVRNPWDEGRITYEKTKGSGRIVARAQEEEDSVALYIKEDLAGAIMEIVK